MCNRIFYYSLVTFLLAVLVVIVVLLLIQQWNNGYLQEHPLSSLLAFGMFVSLIATLIRRYYSLHREE